MDINDLRDGMRKVEVEGEISDKSETRTVNLRTGGQANVADFTLKDETGSIKLTLWEEQIEQVSVGSKVKIENGYTNSFRSEVRVNVGRYGKLSILE